MRRLAKRGNGFVRSCRATLTITPYRATVEGCEPFGMGLGDSGGWYCAAGGNADPGPGSDWRLTPTDGFHPHGSCIRIRVFALTPSIQDRSRMRKIRSYGSVRGASGNRCPYRDPSTSATAVPQHLPTPAPPPGACRTGYARVPLSGGHFYSSPASMPRTLWEPATASDIR
jgi:hypothetical protein